MQHSARLQLRRTLAATVTASTTAAPSPTGGLVRLWRWPHDGPVNVDSPYFSAYYHHSDARAPGAGADSAPPPPASVTGTVPCDEEIHSFRSGEAFESCLQRRDDAANGEEAHTEGAQDPYKAALEFIPTPFGDPDVVIPSLEDMTAAWRRWRWRAGDPLRPQPNPLSSSSAVEEREGRGEAADGHGWEEADNWMDAAAPTGFLSDSRNEEERLNAQLQELCSACDEAKNQLALSLLAAKHYRKSYQRGCRALRGQAQAIVHAAEAARTKAPNNEESSNQEQTDPLREAVMAVLCQSEARLGIPWMTESARAGPFPLL